MIPKRKFNIMRNGAAVSVPAVRNCSTGRRRGRAIGNTRPKVKFIEHVKFSKSVPVRRAVVSCRRAVFGARAWRRCRTAVRAKRVNCHTRLAAGRWGAVSPTRRNCTAVVTGDSGGSGTRTDPRLPFHRLEGTAQPAQRMTRRCGKNATARLSSPWTTRSRATFRKKTPSCSCGTTRQ